MLHFASVVTFCGVTNQFQWDEQVQGRSFKQVKEILSAAPVLKFFDPKEEVEIQCDASDRGLGACLMQRGQPVAYASRSMTATKVNYAQIGKELRWLCTPEFTYP